MKNNVKWPYLICSLVVSILLAIIYIYTKDHFKLFSDGVMSFLSFTSLPALYISCMVILNVKDVQDKIKTINDYLSDITEFEKNAKIYFYSNYSDNKGNGFLGHYTQLQSDIDLIITQKMGTNEKEVMGRMTEASYRCRNYIENFSYVKAYIETMDLKKKTITCGKEEEAKGKVYLSFSTEMQDKLLTLLSEIYKMKELLEIEKLEKTRDLLVGYDKVCEMLSKEIAKEINAYNGGKTENYDEEVRIDE